MPNNVKSNKRTGKVIKPDAPKSRIVREDVDPRERGTKGGSTFKSCNDIKWYNQYPELLRDAGSIQYSNALGTGVKFGPADSSSISIPGIMILDYLPCIGENQGESSPINVASRLLYSYIRHANSGSRNYEAPDYFMYLLAVASMHTFVAELWRVYGLLNLYSVKNRYVNKPIVAALGFDYDDLISNMAQFRYYVNYFAAKVNTFAVPKNMNYFDRNIFLPQHVFKDSGVAKSQFYAFKPKFYYKWDGTVSQNGSALITTSLPMMAKYSDVVAFGNQLIDALLGNEDLGLMSGDTLKCFGSDGIRSVGYLPEIYITNPIHDEGMLAQIHNATISPVVTIDDDSIIIKQTDTGTIEQSFNFTGEQHPMATFFLDSGMDDPSPEFTMEASRLMCVCALENENIILKAAGTEIVVGVKLINLDPETGAPNLVVQIETGTRFVPYDTSELIMATEAHSKFDWAPLLYVAETSDSPTTFVFGDLYNYTTVGVTELAKLHNVALQSLFNTIGLYANKSK